jgi:hypothetical protein
VRTKWFIMGTVSELPAQGKSKSNINPPTVVQWETTVRDLLDRPAEHIQSFQLQHGSQTSQQLTSFTNVATADILHKCRNN